LHKQKQEYVHGPGTSDIKTGNRQDEWVENAASAMSPNLASASGDV